MLFIKIKEQEYPDEKESKKINSPYITDTAQKIDGYFKIIKSLKNS